MLRHKAMIQAARLAFGFVGIFDQDEAERITEGPKVIDADTGEIRRFDVIAACNEVEAAETLEALQEVWKRQGALAVDAQDKAGHAALKQAVLDRKAKLQKDAVTDVDAKEEVQA